MTQPLLPSRKALWASLLASAGILTSCVREAQRPAPLQSSQAAAARNTVTPLVRGQWEPAAACMLHSLSLGRARPSLRCQACSRGHALDISQGSAAPPPTPSHKSDFSAPTFAQPLKGRCINPSRACKREETAKGLGADTR